MGNRPIQRENLDRCEVCNDPATSWADGPGGAAVGCCSEQCRHLIAMAAKTQDEYGLPEPCVEPEYRTCPFCRRTMPVREGAFVYHNLRDPSFVPHPTMPGVQIGNRCPGTGCVPRVQEAS